MIDLGKRNIAGILVDAVDYEGATDRIVTAAKERRDFAGTALAVHGLMEGVRDGELGYRLNHLDLVTADGQPVRWALNRLHRIELPDRCYGPTLMLRVCEAAAAAGLRVYLYGSTRETLAPLVANLKASFAGLQIAGSAPSTFHRVTPTELDAIAADIRGTGADIVFVGLGCPRQEVFAYEMRERVHRPLLAVGAAFDYHAGLLEEPPAWVQRAGLQWIWRLAAEPSRLWRRYLSTNPAFVACVGRQALGREVALVGREPARELGYA